MKNALPVLSKSLDAAGKRTQWQVSDGGLSVSAVSEVSEVLATEQADSWPLHSQGGRACLRDATGRAVRRGPKIQVHQREMSSANIRGGTGIVG